MRHLIDPLDFSPEEIDSLLNLADRIRSDPAAYQDVAAHKKLATLFYEPSTRTRLSFEAATYWVFRARTFPALPRVKASPTPSA